MNYNQIDNQQSLINKSRNSRGHKSSVTSNSTNNSHFRTDKIITSPYQSDFSTNENKSAVLYKDPYGDGVNSRIKLSNIDKENVDYSVNNVDVAHSKLYPSLNRDFSFPHGKINHSSVDSKENRYNFNNSSQPSTLDDDPDELSLLEELGVDKAQIIQRMKSVILFHSFEHELHEDLDLCGPMLIAIFLACILLLCGKVHFGYIYGLSVTGCLSMYILLNLMSQIRKITLYSTVSILGYGLLPVVGLASISVLFPLRNYAGTSCSLACILWSTATASRFFENVLGMVDQRYLIAYPISIIYGCFVLLTINVYSSDDSTKETCFFE